MADYRFEPSSGELNEYAQQKTGKPALIAVVALAAGALTTAFLEPRGLGWTWPALATLAGAGVAWAGEYAYHRYRAFEEVGRRDYQRLASAYDKEVQKREGLEKLLANVRRDLSYPEWGLRNKPEAEALAIELSHERAKLRLCNRDLLEAQRLIKEFAKPASP
jgi:hypothetical protein